MKLRRYKISDIKKGTRVLLRVDANVPIKNGRVSEGAYGRIAQSIPEIKALLKRGATVILMTHLGDPKGRVVKSLSVAPIAREYSRLLKRDVSIGLAPDCQISILENLRFKSGEEKNDPRFARELAQLGDLYVNNAFGVCHRRHASVNAITKFLPSYAGELLAREVTELSRTSRKPLLLVMGGLKLSTKMPLLQKLAPKASAILTGGGLAVTLLAAKRTIPMTVAGELVGADEIKLAQSALTKFGEKIILPIDVRVRSSGPKVSEVMIRDVHARQVVLDIGSHTALRYQQMLRIGGGVIWNGPMGIIEDRAGQDGTKAIASTLSILKVARSIVGGGDTVSFLEDHKFASGFSFVSTGGGAMLAFLAGEELPGISPLVIK
jgi:phosphoglycerate kinase